MKKIYIKKEETSTAAEANEFLHIVTVSHSKNPFICKCIKKKVLFIMRPPRNSFDLNNLEKETHVDGNLSHIINFACT